MNLFDKSKAKKASGKAEKKIIQIKDDNLRDSIIKLADINSKMAGLKAIADALGGEVRERGISEFIHAYSKEKKFTGSLNIHVSGTSGDTGGFMFIPTDRYITIDETRYEELISKYGEDIAVEETKYEMDSKLVEKWGSIISELIGNCEEIPDEDKENLIKITSSYTVKKGAINDIEKIGGSLHEATIAEVLDEIKPVYQLKGIQVIED